MPTQWTPRKSDPSEINGGYRFETGSSISIPEDLARSVENNLYAAMVADNAKDVASTAAGDAASATQSASDAATSAASADARATVAEVAAVNAEVAAEVASIQATNSATSATNSLTAAQSAEQAALSTESMVSVAQQAATNAEDSARRAAEAAEQLAQDGGTLVFVDNEQKTRIDFTSDPQEQIDYLKERPVPSSRELGQIVEFGASLTPAEQTTMSVLPMDGRSVQDVDPYRQLFAFLNERGMLRMDEVENLPNGIYRDPIIVGDKIVFRFNTGTTSSLLILNTKTDEFITTLSFDNRYLPNQHSAVIGDKIYFGNTIDQSMMRVLDTTNGVVYTISGLPNVQRRNYATIGSLIYWLDSIGNNITVIDTTTDQFSLIILSDATFTPSGSINYINNKVFITENDTRVTRILVLDIINSSQRFITGLPSMSWGRIMNPAILGDELFYGHTGEGHWIMRVDSISETFIGIQHTVMQSTTVINANDRIYYSGRTGPVENSQNPVIRYIDLINSSSSVISTAGFQLPWRTPQIHEELVFLPITGANINMLNTNTNQIVSKQATLNTRHFDDVIILNNIALFGNSIATDTIIAYDIRNDFINTFTDLTTRRYETPVLVNNRVFWSSSGTTPLQTIIQTTSTSTILTPRKNHYIAY